MKNFQELLSKDYEIDKNAFEKDFATTAYELESQISKDKPEQIDPRLIVHTWDGKSFKREEFVLTIDGPSPEARNRNLYQLGYSLSGIYRTIEYLLFYSEIWVSTREVKRVIDDPNKTEGFMLVGLLLDLRLLPIAIYARNYAYIQWEIRRGKKNEIILCNREDTSDVKPALLEFFVNGFLTGQEEYYNTDKGKEEINKTKEYLRKHDIEV